MNGCISVQALQKYNLPITNNCATLRAYQIPSMIILNEMRIWMIPAGDLGRCSVQSVTVSYKIIVMQISQMSKEELVSLCLTSHDLDFDL